MIYVFFSGGIGNQLFQYAFARHLSIEFNDKLVFVTEFYKNEEESREFLMTSLLKNDNEFIQKIELNKFNRINFKVRKSISLLLMKVLRWGTKTERMDRLFKINAMFLGIYIFPTTDKKNISFYKSYQKNIYIEGIYASEEYFIKNKSIILDEISFDNIHVSNYTNEQLKKVRKSNSVCVHIRRGDYFEDKWKFMQVCNETYYEKATKLIAGLITDPTFFVFSDDIEWVKNNISFTNNSVFIPSDVNTIESLLLMSSCNHYIISNSTFSFWAMYLNKDINKKVIAPSYWHANKEKMPIYMDSWLLVDPSI